MRLGSGRSERPVDRVLAGGFTGRGQRQRRRREFSYYDNRQYSWYFPCDQWFDQRGRRDGPRVPRERLPLGQRHPQLLLAPAQYRDVQLQHDVLRLDHHDLLGTVRVQQYRTALHPVLAVGLLHLLRRFELQRFATFQRIQPRAELLMSGDRASRWGRLVPERWVLLREQRKREPSEHRGDQPGQAQPLWLRQLHG